MCIPHSAVCDGVENCSDGSDETTSECRGNIIIHNENVSMSSYFLKGYIYVGYFIVHGVLGIWGGGQI
jgi:Low-density lipoprotein receptor domain class A.